MKQRIFVLWATGNVWKELIKQIVTLDGQKNHINPSVIVWIANSSHYIFDETWINTDLLLDISKWEKARELMWEKWEQLNELSSLIQLVKNHWMDWEIVFADVTAWKKELLNFHKYVLQESSNFLVTANKNPLSLYSMKDFIELTSCTGRYDTNTTVMWGWGVLNFVYERTDKIKDTIESVEWVLSGTLWYIMSELKKWQATFSQIVKKAHAEWYTEPNPWDDLNGLDVARKLVILARYSGYSVDISDVEVEPLVWEKYARYCWDEFLKQLENEDEFFKQQTSIAKSNWKTLAYVWKIEYYDSEIKMTVWLDMVDNSSDIASLEWTANIAIVETQILAKPLPHVIKSRWAGLWVTAASVRVWIAKMLPSSVMTR